MFKESLQLPLNKLKDGVKESYENHIMSCDTFKFAKISQRLSQRQKFWEIDV